MSEANETRGEGFAKEEEDVDSRRKRRLLAPPVRCREPTPKEERYLRR
jgi:hypothetical protein